MLDSIKKEKLRRSAAQKVSDIIFGFKSSQQEEVNAAEEFENLNRLN